MTEPAPKTCTAPARQQKAASTPLGFLKQLLEAGVAPRCGAPAVKETVLGPMCQACYDRIEEGRKNRTNVLGLLQELLGDGKTAEAFRQYKKRVDEGADPIEAMHGHVCGPNCWHNMDRKKTS